MSDPQIDDIPSATPSATETSDIEQSTEPSSTQDDNQTPTPTPTPTPDEQPSYTQPSAMPTPSAVPEGPEDTSSAPEPTKPPPPSTPVPTEQDTTTPADSDSAVTRTHAPSSKTTFFEAWTEPEDDGSPSLSHGQASAVPPSDTPTVSNPNPTISSEKPYQTHTPDEQPLERPTDDFEWVSIAPTSTSTSTWQAAGTWVPPPSSSAWQKPTSAPAAQIQQPSATPPASSAWSDWSGGSTDPAEQSRNASQTFQSTPETVVAAVAVETTTVTIPVTTSSVYVNVAGETRTSSWVQTTTYSTVRLPDRTVTVSGKAETHVTVVAGSSTATVFAPAQPTDADGSASESANASNSSLSSGGIAGIIVGCIGATAAILVLLFLFCKRRRSGAVKLAEEDQYGITPRTGLKRSGTQRSALDFSDGPLSSRQPTFLETVPEMPEAVMQRVSKDGEWEYASDDAQRSPLQNADSERGFTHYDDWLAYEYANSPFSERHAALGGAGGQTTMAQVGEGDNVSVTIRSPKNSTHSMYGVPYDAYGNAYSSPRFATPKLHAGPSIPSLHSVSTVEPTHMGLSGEICSTDDASSTGHESMAYSTPTSHTNTSLIAQSGHMHSPCGTFGIAR